MWTIFYYCYCISYNIYLRGWFLHKHPSRLLQATVGFAQQLTNLGRSCYPMVQDFPCSMVQGLPCSRTHCCGQYGIRQYGIFAAYGIDKIIGWNVPLLCSVHKLQSRWRKTNQLCGLDPQQQTKRCVKTKLGKHVKWKIKKLRICSICIYLFLDRVQLAQNFN